MSSKPARKRSEHKDRAAPKRPRSQYVLMVLFAALVVLILLLRMAVFVAGHARHHF